MTLASIPLMDRTGRRTLHLYGLGGMFIFSIFITISFLIKASQFLMLETSNKRTYKLKLDQIDSKIKRIFSYAISKRKTHSFVRYFNI